MTLKDFTRNAIRAGRRYVALTKKRIFLPNDFPTVLDKSGIKQLLDRVIVAAVEDQKLPDDAVQLTEQVDQLLARLERAARLAIVVRGVEFVDALVQVSQDTIQRLGEVANSLVKPKHLQLAGQIFFKFVDLLAASKKPSVS